MSKSEEVVSQAAGLAQRGAVAEAFEMLRTACGDGNALAAATLADWRLSGAVIRRDLSEARDYYSLAARLGFDAVEPVHIALLATGAGGSGRNWSKALELLEGRSVREPDAARQLKLLGAMALDREGESLASIRRRAVHTEPLIERIPGFLSPDEAHYLAEQAIPMLQPAVVINPQSGAVMQDPIRTARSAAFPFVLENPFIHAINRRIAAATGTRYEQGEPLQVLSYDPGEEYKLHSDALPQGQNQRLQTFLVAMSDGFEGGETSFPRLGINLRGRIGDAIRFTNTDAAGQPDHDAWHAGLPVLRGRKLLLSKWIRERPLDLSGPPGRPF